MMELAHFFLSIAITIVVCWGAQTAIEVGSVTGPAHIVVTITTVACAIGVMATTVHELLLSLRESRDHRLQTQKSRPAKVKSIPPRPKRRKRSVGSRISSARIKRK